MFCSFPCNHGGPSLPAVRLKAFVQAINGEENLVWAYSPMCAFGDNPFQKFLDRMRGFMAGLPCLPAPLKGCADVGAEFGSPEADRTCEINSRCLPNCQVTEVFRRGTPTEQPIDVPHCLEVMSDGTVIPGNTDRVLAYANGYPDTRDANLPVHACWYITFNENCGESNYAQMRFSRRNDPAPRTFAEVTCARIDQVERNCVDGVDNDEDCLVDAEDTDCP